jgi:hypothetical protein
METNASDIDSASLPQGKGPWHEHQDEQENVDFYDATTGKQHEDEPREGDWRSGDEEGGKQHFKTNARAQTAPAISVPIIWATSAENSSHYIHIVEASPTEMLSP